MSKKEPFAFRNATTANLTSFSSRMEHHGDNEVQAFDLHFSKDVPNTFLDIVEPGLRECLYYNAAAKAGQTALAGVGDATPDLRFPKLDGGVHTIMDKKDVLPGYDLLMEFGLGDDISNMAFDCCKVKLQKIETKEGGTVRLHWSVAYAGDRADWMALGKLAFQAGSEVTLRLVPPAVPTIEKEKPAQQENPFPIKGDDRQQELTPETALTGSQPAGAAGGGGGPDGGGEESGDSKGPKPSPASRRRSLASKIAHVTG